MPAEPDCEGSALVSVSTKSCHIRRSTLAQQACSVEDRRNRLTAPFRNCLEKRWRKWSGTTRSRVNFVMHKFRRLGFIDYNGDLKINNALLSVVLRN